MLVDKTKGVVRIPIEAAMEKVAAGAMPRWSAAVTTRFSFAPLALGALVSTARARLSRARAEKPALAFPRGSEQPLAALQTSTSSSTSAIGCRRIDIHQFWRRGRLARRAHGGDKPCS